jgi:hypothetical protein
MPSLGVTNNNLYETLTHELGHGWGIQDEYNQLCGGVSYQSAMAQNCPDGRTITRRDIGSMNALYGRRSGRYYDDVTSPDLGLTWYGIGQSTYHEAFSRLSTLGIASTSSYQVYPRSMAASALGSSGWTQAWRGYFAASVASVVPYSDNRSQSWDIAGGAERDTLHYAIAYRTEETEQSCTKYVAVSITSDGGYTWGNPIYVLNNGSPTRAKVKERGEGVAIAYDPQQDVYVVASTNALATDELYVETIDALPPYAVGAAIFLNTAGQFSFDHPTITCNNIAYTGSENCLIAWLDTTADFATNFQFGHIQPGVSKQFATAGTVRQHGYVGWQPPSVTAMRSTAFPWLLTLKQGTSIYTWRYATASQSWVDERNVVWTGPSGVPGLLAAVVGADSVEVFLKYIQN